MAQKIQFIAGVLNQPRAPDPRRAVHRARPGQRRGRQGRGARPQEGGDDRGLLHARHVGRRAALRPDLHDLQGPEGPRRHARRDPVDLRLTTRSGCGPRPGMDALEAMAGIEEINDQGNFQEVRWSGDPQALARDPDGADPDHSLRGRAAVVARYLRADRRARAGAQEAAMRPDSRRIWVVASTEFGSSIRTKSFLIVDRWSCLIIGVVDPVPTVRDKRVDTRTRIDRRDRPHRRALPGDRNSRAGLQRPVARCPGCRSDPAPDRGLADRSR